jgi:RNA polymerase sigma factor (sigma-70 family)
VEPWVSTLRDGDTQAAWDLFAERYRRLILATIRRLVDDEDQVMDVFSRVCQALIENDFARLRRYDEQRDRAASVSTWLVAVVRNQTVDWLRQQHGRQQPVKEVGNWPADRPHSMEASTSEVDPAAASESARILAAALAHYPPDVQLAVQLFIVNEMPAAAVAQAVGWANAKAVYNRVYRVLDAVREDLARQGIGHGDL